MEFATKKDVIKKYTEKRKVFTDEKEVEEILNSLLTFIVKKLNCGYFDSNYAYRLESMGYIYEKEFDLEDIAKDPSSQEYKKAENMLHEYMLSNRIKIKPGYVVKDKKSHRI